jgi:hypothetical protein
MKLNIMNIQRLREIFCYLFSYEKCEIQIMNYDIIINDKLQTMFTLEVDGIGTEVLEASEKVKLHEASSAGFTVCPVELEL